MIKLGTLPGMHMTIIMIKNIGHVFTDLPLLLHLTLLTISPFIKSKIDVDASSAQARDALKAAKTYIVTNAIDYRLPRNMTLLHRAVLSRDPESVVLLLARNASVNPLSQSGMTPLDMAQQLHGEESSVARLLQERGALSGASLRAQAEKHEEMKRREAELIILASIGNTEGVRRLLALGVTINAQDKQGNTALILAARNGYYDTVVLLLENNARRDIANRQRLTACALAYAMGHHGIAVLVDPNTTH
jgi:ankyrin repeat protein